MYRYLTSSLCIRSCIRSSNKYTCIYRPAKYAFICFRYALQYAYLSNLSKMPFKFYINTKVKHFRLQTFCNLSMPMGFANIHVIHNVVQAITVICNMKMHKLAFSPEKNYSRNLQKHYRVSIMQCVSIAHYYYSE